MPPVCILTDSTVQFPNPVFEGRKLVNVLAPVWLGTTNGSEELKTADFPLSRHSPDPVPQLAIPSVREFETSFKGIGEHYEGIIAIVHSGEFSPTYQNAMRAAQNLQGQVPVRVIDSKAISLGLGLVVQRTAQAAIEGAPLADLEQFARSLIPRLYSLLCIPGLSFLELADYVNPSQARVGEYMGVLPIFVIDNGELQATEKARNTRHLVDIFYEFLSEFVDLDHIALLQGAPAFEQETRALRERLAEDNNVTPISEQIINAPMASLIGPHSLGVFALQG
jgi:DegV family protein with EDD domain